MSVRVSHKVVLAFGVPTLVFVALGAACFLVFSRLTRESARVAHTRQVLLELKTLELATARADAGKPASVVAAALDRLGRLFQQSPAQAARLGVLGPLLDRLAQGRLDPQGEAALSRGLSELEQQEAALLAVREANQATEVGRMQWALALGTLAALLFTLSVGTALVRSLTRRLGLLAEAAERVGRGEFVNVAVGGSDELALVAQAFDTMSRRRKEAEAALREASASAHAANKELEAFSYSVSHDLRAPLRSIDGFSQALLEDCGEALPPVGHDHLKRVRAAAQRMGILIDDLLQLSRVARAPLAREALDLSAMARGILDELKARAPRRTVELAIEEGLAAEGDARLVKIAFTNLLENAWKFSARKERAKIEVGRAGGGFFVRDNGAGYDPLYQDKLFGAFQRLHPASEFEGTGIGLATVQRVVARHGGRVWSEGRPGEGATFFFTLGDTAEDS